MDKSYILQYLSELVISLNEVKRCLCSPHAHVEKAGYVNLGIACDNLSHLIETINYVDSQEKEADRQEKDSEDENTYATIKDVKELINLMKGGS